MRCALLTAVILPLLVTATAAQTASYSESRLVMGSAFTLTAVAADEAAARQAVEAGFEEAVRIERLISSWDPQSETAAVNRMAGIAPVKVSRELFDLIYRSKKVSELTGGLFDVSFASIDRLWRFDGTLTTLPDSAEVARSVALIDYRNIALNRDSLTVFLRHAGMKIGFGAIGKGYAANRCKAVMQNLGIESGVVNAGGDLIAWGSQSGGKPWTIGIADPERQDHALSWLEIGGMAVVTSGDYERFVEIDGRRFAHIINPKTGWPAQGLRSVTIICPDAELADALATAVFLMGSDQGIRFVNTLAQVECLLVDDAGRLHASDGVNLYLQEIDGTRE